MNFFEHQERAFKKTRLLFGIFAITILLLICGIYGIISLVLCSSTEAPIQFQPKLFLAVSIGVLLIVSLGSIFKVIKLRTGGGAVAEALGGIRVPTDSQDPQLRTLLNVVEEMAIASGITVPPVYLIEQDSINAFAAGYTLDSAVIGITRGALQQLNRSELQGVVAHEFSHILNGDMRLNIRLIGLLHGLLIISLIGRRILFSVNQRRYYSSSGKRGDSALPLLVGLLLSIVGWLGVLGGRLIKAAISRQREFLADASAVQFTRNPHGIGNALRKIAHITAGSRIQHPESEQFSHLFFATGVTASWLQLLATHPPLIERIKRVDPIGSSENVTLSETSSAPGTTVEAQLNPLATFSPPGWTQEVGTILPEHLENSKTLIADLPKEVAALSRTLNGAQALIIHTLLHHTDSQLASIPKEIEVEEDINHAFIKIRTLLSDSPVPYLERVLPLIEIALGTLSSMPQDDKERFLGIVKDISALDGQISLFEYMLHRMFQNHFSKHSLGHKHFPKRKTLEAIHTLLSLFDLHGSHEHKGIGYRKARESFYPELPDSLIAPPKDVLTLLDSSLTILEGLPPQGKRKLLSAVEVIIHQDTSVSQTELELFRTIGATLQCPVPLLKISTAT